MVFVVTSRPATGDENGETYQALLWGGTAFNFGNRPDRLERITRYILSTQRARALVRGNDIRVFLSNHSLFDEAVEKLEALPLANTNPFVMSCSTVERALTVMEECAHAALSHWLNS